MSGKFWIRQEGPGSGYATLIGAKTDLLMMLWLVREGMVRCHEAAGYKQVPAGAIPHRYPAMNLTFRLTERTVSRDLSKI
jgi:hypothetical protein